MRALALALCTAALGPAADPFIFAVIGDPQIGMVELERDRDRFARVVAAVNALPPAERPAFVILAGDLVHDMSNEAQNAAFLQVKRGLSMPVHLVLGNHDVPKGGVVEGADRFSFEHAGRLFVGLNGNLWSGDQKPAAEQFAWLEKQLKGARGRQIFVVQHQPLYTVEPGEKDGYFNTPLAWRGKLLKLFEEAGVTAVLTGHLHRNASGRYRSVSLLTTPSPARNFDNSPAGYRLVRVGDEGFVETYIGLPPQ